ncbi:MAG: hypothetical protein U1F33_04330 [Alphaproteobacteria bacterium]
MSHFLGIYREHDHSPGHEDNDAAILEATAEALRARDATVRLCRPDQLPDALRPAPHLIFAMCETEPCLAGLDRARAAGITVINAPDGIRNNFRYRLIRRLADAPLRFPRSEVIELAGTTPWPGKPLWLKRYDFHATEPGDVLFAGDEAQWSHSLARFSARGFAKIIAQEHVDGDLVKFYGVAGRWFRWFYHRDEPAEDGRIDLGALRGSADAAAAALGLDVFGGDAIIGADGSPTIIDLNAWPSFARFRSEAAAAIADLLMFRVDARTTAVRASAT